MFATVPPPQLAFCLPQKRQILLVSEPVLFDSEPFQQITVHYYLILKLIVCGTRSYCTSRPYLSNTGDKWIIKGREQHYLCSLHLGVEQ